MGFAAAGADRFFKPIIGQAVPAVTANMVKSKLHTAATPTAANELNGHGYDDVVLAANAFTRTTSGTYRRLNLPAMEWFADADAMAQVAESIALWHENTLIWHGETTITPQNARVFANAGDIILSVELTDASLAITQDAMDRALRALAGEAVAAADMFWELHSGNTVPTAATRLTGGGIDGIPDAAWTFSTVSGYRRAAQGALLFSGGLMADTTAEPTRIGLWRGRPEAGGVLHAWGPVSPDNMTESGSVITVNANQLYFELKMEGTVVP